MLSVLRQRQTDRQTHTQTDRQAGRLLVFALVNQSFDSNLIPPTILAIHRREGNNREVTGQSKRGRERGWKGERERERRREGERERELQTTKSFL